MTDKFQNQEPGLQAPASNAAAITPNDAADLTNITRAIYVGTGGDLKVTMRGGQTVTFTAVQGGTLLPIRSARVWSTGTTASSLVGVW